MRQFVLAVAVAAALIGCDTKSEGAAKPPADGAKTGETARPSEEGKPAEGPKVSKHPWGSFKKGSFAKSKSTNEMEVGGNKVKTESTTTQTLKEITPDEAIIEIETVMSNVPTPTKVEQKIPLKAAEGKPGDGPRPKSGSEEIEVAGKKLKCDWTETETDVNGAKTVTRVYTSPEIPGFTAKMTVKSPTMSLTQEVVEFSAK
jgi:hypothetical protein